MDSRRSIIAAGAAILMIGALSTIPIGNAAPPASARGDACSLLTRAQVSTALGVTTEPGRRLVASSPISCGWSEPGAPRLTAKKVVLTLMTPRQFDLGKKPLQGTTKTPVGGIGEDAYYVTAPGLGTALNVKKGAFLFQMKVGGAGLSVEKIKAMEKTLALELLAQA